MTSTKPLLTLSFLLLFLSLIGCSSDGGSDPDGDVDEDRDAVDGDAGDGDGVDGDGVDGDGTDGDWSEQAEEGEGDVEVPGEVDWEVADGDIESDGDLESENDIEQEDEPDIEGEADPDMEREQEAEGDLPADGDLEFEEIEPAINHPPLLKLPTFASDLPEGESLVLHISAVDEDGDPIRLSASGLEHASWIEACGDEACDSSCLDDCATNCTSSDCSRDCSLAWLDSPADMPDDEQSTARAELETCRQESLADCASCLSECAGSCSMASRTSESSAHAFYHLLPPYDLIQGPGPASSLFVKLSADDAQTVVQDWLHARVSDSPLPPRIASDATGLSMLEGTSGRIEVKAWDYEGQDLQIGVSPLPPVLSVDSRDGALASAQLTFSAGMQSAEAWHGRLWLRTTAGRRDQPWVHGQCAAFFDIEQSAAPVLSLDSNACRTTLAGGGTSGFPVVASADFNGDDLLELAYVSNSAYISITFSSTCGGCTCLNHMNDIVPMAIVQLLGSGDFNNDNLDDIVYHTNFVGLKLIVLMSLGNGNFLPPSIFSLSGLTALTVMTSRDLDGDDLADVAACGSNTGGEDRLLTFAGPGDGSLSTQASWLLSDDSCRRIVAGNLDDTDALDLVVLGADKLWIKTTEEVDSLPCEVAIPGVSDAATADVDADGLDEILVLTRSGIAYILDAFESCPPDIRPLFLPGGLLPATFDFITAADLNGDGIPDLVAADNANLRLALMLGDGYPGTATGTFTHAQSIDMDSELQYIHSGSFIDYATKSHLPGDADLLVVTAAGSQAISFPTQSVLSPEPSGAFASHVDVEIDSAMLKPARLAVSDPDANGRFDVMAVGESENRYLAIRTHGNGGIWDLNPATVETLAFPTDLPPHDLIAADWNGSGIEDLLLAGESLSVAAGKGLRADTEGLYGDPMSTLHVSRDSRLFSGDFNNDGRPDIGLAGPAWLEVLLNLSSTPEYIDFQSSWSRIGGWVGEAIAIDFDRDGILDIVTGAGEVFLGDGSTGTGSGGFTHLMQLPALIGETGVMLRKGDLDSDGRPELVLGLVDQARIQVLRDGDELIADLSGGSPPLQALLTADLNGDRSVDLLWVSAPSLDAGKWTSPLFIQYGNGDSAFQAPPTQIDLEGCVLSDLKVGDWNNDGMADLVLSCRADTASNLNGLRFLFQ